ncbi:potassium/proton antiporter [Elioraea sp.]|uniref:potassium/proton antiporter n=1 Tax=Elioraea sp. TaxID=2185103 RepID=UPI003F70DBE4
MDWIFTTIFIGAALIVLSVLTSLIAFRFGTPLLLFFLGIGLLAGEDGLGLQFDDAASAYFVGSLALAVILFDSGFSTRWRTFRQAAGPAVVLATLGVLLTTAFLGACIHYIFDAPWPESLLISAIVSSTDAAAVFFLLRTGGITIKETVRATLEVESGSNDPMAVFLTVLLVELVASGGGLDGLTTDLLIGFMTQMGLGLVFGIAGGLLIVQLVNRVELESALYPIIVLAAALVLFSLTGALGGSGFLAAYVSGLVSGNRRMRAIQSLRRFQEGMTWLAQISMFLILGLLATPSEFPAAAPPAIAIALLLSFVVRPVAVWLCLLPFGFSRNENAFISWVGLRGAVSILLAILPLIGNLPNGQLYFNTAFIIVLSSLLIQGWTIKSMARRLGVMVPPRMGPVQRVDLDLPGTASHELIVYRVVEHSPVVRGERLPRWARPSLVVRDGQSMRFQYAGRLQAGDYVYMFIPPRFTRLLDRLFASPATVEEDDSDFYGRHVVDPKQTLAALREAHGVAVPARSLDREVNTFMLSRLGGSAEIGDRVPCGDAELIVREVDAQGNVTEAGLALGEDAQKWQLPLFLSGREMIDLARRSIRRLTRR